MKNIITTLVLIFVLSAVALAQNFSGPPAFTPDVLDNPIDGGLGLLLGAGAAYGAKKLRDHRQKKAREQKDEANHEA
jgi:hypothetical protein